MRIAALLFVAGVALLRLGAPGASHAQVLLPVADSKFQKLKFADSLTSVNDRCVVTHNRLNPAIHPLYVNGRPVGFC
jgi:hypothetical protein